MQRYFPNALERLTEEFARLPGIGGKTAQRLAFHLLSLSDEEAQGFADAIIAAKRTVHTCPICQNLTDAEQCPICADEARDHSVICVVAEPRDVIAMERAREFNGVYHVLHGVISPLNHVGPDDVIPRARPPQCTSPVCSARWRSRLRAWPTAFPSAVSWNTPTR